MTQAQDETPQHERKAFLPLGSVVILKGSVKKLLIVSRGSIVEDSFFDYGAFLYPEGMIDTNVAYFNGDDVLKVVFEGYRDNDDELVLEILNDAYIQFLQGKIDTVPAPLPEAFADLKTEDDDPFASVRDIGDDNE